MSGALGQSGGEARKIVVGARQAEAKQIAIRRKFPAPDVMAREPRVQGSRLRMTDQPEQRGAADDGVSRRGEQAIQAIRLPLKLAAHGVGPRFVAQRGLADRERGTRDRPRPERGAQLRDDLRRADREAEPQARQAVEFSERAQENDRQVRAEIGGCRGRLNVDEGFVNDKPTTARAKRCRNGRDRLARQQSAVRVVRIDDDGMSCVVRQRIDAVDGQCPMPRM